MGICYSDNRKFTQLSNAKQQPFGHSTNYAKLWDPQPVSFERERDRCLLNKSLAGA